MAHFSTSYVERSNVTVSKNLRSFTRLTNGFFKKVENHAYAVALPTMYCRFVPVRQKLRTSLAMAACVSGRLRDLSGIVTLIKADKRPPDRKRGPYKKQVSV
jgi:hypothetical protein